MNSISRRRFMRTMGATAGLSMLGVPALSQWAYPVSESNRKLKVVVVGAHPDDPETICGGTMALFSRAGHEVVSAYLTRGEAGIENKSYDEAAAIRTAELMEACRILQVRPQFLNQIDGGCEINAHQYALVHDFLAIEKPDLVFTHWPIDSHRDHRICSSLVLDAWYNLQKQFELFYCEAMTGTQTRNFTPTDYVDITSVIKQKHAACFAHKSQFIEEEYPLYHGKMEIFRGMEFQCAFAEAFCRQANENRRSII